MKIPKRRKKDPKLEKDGEKEALIKIPKRRKKDPKLEKDEE